MAEYQVVDRCDFRPGQVVNGQYFIKKTLGEGSFGVVYLVDDTYGNRYALKLLRLWEVPSEIRQPLMERFEMEFKTGQIPCENLVQSIDFGKVGGNPFIVMEFCPGGDLEPLLGKTTNATRICQEILSGLSALHTQGKVHRDLKPENVLFKQNGVAALTDFGIAGDRTHRMTQRNIFGKPNQIFGTYAYMPPEQVNRARGGATVLPTTDIFSFGVLTYQLLTGNLPFGTLESHNELAEYQIRGKNGDWQRDALRHLPNAHEWTRLIEGCLVPDFRHRLQTVKDVLDLIPQDAHAPNMQPVRLYTYQPQQHTRGYILRIMQGDEYGRTFDISSIVQSGLKILTIGRQKDNTICVKSDHSDYLSRHHCTIESGIGQWIVRDGQWRRDQGKWVNSRNGTYVNSHAVSHFGYYLKPGDIITIGDVTMRFENY